MRSIIVAAVIKSVVGSTEDGSASIAAPQSWSLLEMLRSLRFSEKSPWIDEKMYDQMVQESRNTIESVRMVECNGLDQKKEPLIDSIDKCFGKIKYNSIRGKAQFLLHQSCTLAGLNTPPPSPPATPMGKMKKVLKTIATALGPDARGNRELLDAIITEGLVFARDLRGVCTKPDLNTFQCPVTQEHPSGIDWESIEFPNEYGEEMKMVVKEIYENLLNRDCIVFKGIDQILRDTERIQLAPKLLDIVRAENQGRRRPASAPIVAETDHGLPTSADVVGEAPESSTGVAAGEAEPVRGGDGGPIVVKSTTTLAESVTEQFNEKLENDSKEIKDQFFAEIRTMYSACTEAASIYSFVARNATSELNTFFEGRSMTGPLSDERWRKFSYPDRAIRLPFHYYQGLADVCYYVMFFERRPPPVDSPIGTPGIYPKPHDMLNVLATVIEDVHDLPLGPAETVRDPYHAYQAERFVSAANRYAGVSLRTDVDPEEMMTKIGGSLSTILTRSFIDENPDLHWEPVSKDDPTPRLVKLWSFVLSNGGHYGMMAFIFEAYKQIARTDAYKRAPEVLKQLNKPLQTLREGTLFEDTLREAQTIMTMRTSWEDDGKKKSFSQFIDEIEMEAILQVRPPTRSTDAAAAQDTP